MLGPFPAPPPKPVKSALETSLLHHPSLCAKPLSSLLPPTPYNNSVIPFTSTQICTCPPPVAHPCLPSCPPPHIIFVLFLSPVLPPVSPLPLCHCLPCPLFCVCYFNYSNHLLHSLCFPFTLPFFTGIFPFLSPFPFSALPCYVFSFGQNTRAGLFKAGLR